MKKIIFLSFLILASFSSFANNKTKNTEECSNEYLFNIIASCPGGTYKVVGTLHVFYKCGTYEVTGHYLENKGGCNSTVEEFLLP